MICEGGAEGEREKTGYEPFALHAPIQWAMLGRCDQAEGEIDCPRAYLADGPLAHMYRVTSLTRKRNPLAPYRRPMPRVLEGSQGVERFAQLAREASAPPTSVFVLSRLTFKV